MKSSKFNNETIQLEINRTGYGQYSFQIETSKGKFTKHSTDSILVDAINSDEDDTNDWGTVQDAIDAAVESVLIANNQDYELSPVMSNDNLFETLGNILKPEPTIEKQIWVRIGTNVTINVPEKHSPEDVISELKRVIKEFNPGKLEFHFDGESYFLDDDSENELSFEI